MTDKFENFEGHLEYYLTCPVCGKSGIVYYSKRKPVYCSDACKQHAYRLRKKKRNIKSVTLLKNRLVGDYGEACAVQVMRIYSAFGYDALLETERAIKSALHARQKMLSR